MRSAVSQGVGAFLWLLVGCMCAGSAAGSVLQVEVAAVGGSIASSAPSGCTTYSRPPLIGTFSTGANLVPLGGIASCGYQGGVQGGSAAVGPLLLEQSVTASYTDSSVFNATARARVNYGEMGIYLTGSRNGGGPVWIRAFRLRHRWQREQLEHDFRANKCPDALLGEWLAIWGLYFLLGQLHWLWFSVSPVYSCPG